MSRTDSSLKNLMTAWIGQVIAIIVSLIARIVFLKCLNEEYLGLNGLFTNILTIFSLVELGVGPAMNFSLYRPLARKDIEQIKSLMALYRKAYILIGCLIGIIGLLFTPFYTVFMDTVPAIPQLTQIYWLFTANTVISYFFSYKRALIICDEKRYIATIYQYTFYVLLNVLQIIVLLLTRNYIMFLILQVICTFAENVGISVKADQMYPYLREKTFSPIPKETGHEIKKNISAMLIHKIGSMVVFSSDNIILSKFVGLAAVGLYSNYYLITNALDRVFRQIFTSLTASVGNLNASDKPEDREKLERTFEKVFFADFWIYGFAACCLWVLFNPFISIWLGDSLLFDNFTVLIIVVNFYLTGMRRAVLTFWEATATFYYDRYKPLFEITINLVTSIWLAKQIGAAGVFLGTIISTVSTCLWIEPHVLYKHVFHKKALGYAFRWLIYTAATIMACILTDYIVSCVKFDNAYLGFVVKMFLCLLAPNAFFYLLFHNRDEFVYFKELGKRIICRISRRDISA